MASADSHTNGGGLFLEHSTCNRINKFLPWESAY